MSTNQVMNDSEPSVQQTQIVLPEEVVHEIFLRAIFPSSLLHPSDIWRPNSAWNVNMRTKKAIVLVCRRWYCIGTPFLYEDLALTSPPQAAFHAIQSSPRVSILMPLVKRFIAAFYVPEIWIKWIFETFINLHTFWDATTAHRLPSLKTYLSPNGASITHLVLTGLLPSSDVTQFLHEISTNLMSLEIVAFPALSKDSPPLSFPVMHTLHLWLFESIYDWDCLPSLTALTTTTDFSSWESPGKETDSDSDSSGHTWEKLQYLSISSRANSYIDDTEHDDHPLQGALSHCPNITHLVLKIEDITMSQLVISHPNVQWIDVRIPLVPRTDPGSPACQCGHCDDFLSRFTQANFPALKNIRSICSSLGEFADLPRTFLPSHMEDKVAFQCGDFHLVVSPGEITRIMPGSTPYDGTVVDQDSDSESNDPDWQPDEEGDEFDYSSSSESNSDRSEEDSD